MKGGQARAGAGRPVRSFCNNLSKMKVARLGWQQWRLEQVVFWVHFEAELVGFADGLDKVCERDESRMIPRFWPLWLKQPEE